MLLEVKGDGDGVRQVQHDVSKGDFVVLFVENYVTNADGDCKFFSMVFCLCVFTASYGKRSAPQSRRVRVLSTG